MEWSEALEKRGMKVSRENTEYMCLNGTLLGSVKMQQVTEFNYLGSTLQSDGGMSTEINKRTQCGWNNWMKISVVLCDKRVPPQVKGNIHCKIKVWFYIALYPVRWTAQSALHFPPLTDLFIPTPFSASLGSILAMQQLRNDYSLT